MKLIAESGSTEGVGSALKIIVSYRGFSQRVLNLFFRPDEK